MKTQNYESLLCKIYGLYDLYMKGYKQHLYLMVMENIYPAVRG